jgi:hypothetical protein
MSTYRGIAVENFLTDDEVKTILDFAQSTDSWEKLQPGDFWSDRVIAAQTIYTNHNKEVGQLMFELRNRTADKIKEAYGVENAYADITTLVRWFPGQEQTPHADDMTNVDGHEAFHHREFGSILYLNDNYSGGHTYYPDHGIEVTPKSGMLAVHPGDTDHFHGVTKIEDGIRYTIASFWTTNKDFHDGWSL